MLRIGIVGLGNMGRNHLRVLTNGLADSVTVSMVADPVIERLPDSLHGVTLVRHHEEMDEFVDAVIVAAPTPCHFEIARHFILAGKHVLVEKPIAMTVAEAEELIRLRDQAGTVLQVGFIERFNPAVRVLKELLAGEEIVALEAHRLSYFTPSTAYGNLIVDLMIHDIDVVNYLLDNRRMPTQIAAHGRVVDGDFSHVQALLSYPCGTTVNLHVSRLAHEKVRRLRLYTESKTFTLDYITREVWVSTLGSAQSLERYRGYRIDAGTRHYVVDGEPLLFELRHFVECIQHHIQPETDGIAGADALRIAQEVHDCCLASESSAKPIALR